MGGSPSIKSYRYVGPGQGVPGLPHELDESDAADLGLTEIFKEAVEAGLYKEIKRRAKAAAKSKEGE